MPSLPHRRWFWLAAGVLAATVGLAFSSLFRSWMDGSPQPDGTVDSLLSPPAGAATPRELQARLAKALTTGDKQLAASCYDTTTTSGKIGALLEGLMVEPAVTIFAFIQAGESKYGVQAFWDAFDKALASPGRMYLAFRSWPQHRKLYEHGVLKVTGHQAEVSLTERHSEPGKSTFTLTHVFFSEQHGKWYVKPFLQGPDADLENQIAQQVKEMQPAITQFVGQVEPLIDRCRTIQEFEQRLQPLAAELLRTITPHEQTLNALAQQYFMSQRGGS